MKKHTVFQLITMSLGFSKILEKLLVKYVPPILRVHKIKRSVKDSSNEMFLCVFSDFLFKSICCGYSFELH